MNSLSLGVGDSEQFSAGNYWGIHLSTEEKTNLEIFVSILAIQIMS
jgi:hypothetical protein